MRLAWAEMAPGARREEEASAERAGAVYWGGGWPAGVNTGGAAIRVGAGGDHTGRRA
jgi:hypothetical protein